MGSSDFAKLGGGEEEFFPTGQADVSRLFERLSASGLEPVPGRALDFGCGLGRITQALAGRFDEVDGVDIAASMIEGATRLNHHGARCRYHLNRAPDLRLFPDRTFDLVHSVMTLQHMVPRLALEYVGEFVRVIKVGGVLAFQIPCGPAPTLKALVRTLMPTFARRLYWRLRRRHPIEMFSIPSARVNERLHLAGAVTKGAHPETSAGPNYRSIFYLATRTT